MKTNEQYVKHSGYCPVCDSGNIIGYSMKPSSDGITQEIECNLCGAYWRDHHKLTGFELIDNP